MVEESKLLDLKIESNDKNWWNKITIKPFKFTKM